MYLEQGRYQSQRFIIYHFQWFAYKKRAVWKYGASVIKMICNLMLQYINLFSLRFRETSIVGNNWLILWIICIFVFLSCVCMPVSWASGSFWKRLLSWAEWAFLGSTGASEPKLYRMSSPLLLKPWCLWQIGAGMLALCIEFYICFYQLPFPTLFKLLISPRKSSIL